MIKTFPYGVSFFAQNPSKSQNQPPSPYCKIKCDNGGEDENKENPDNNPGMHGHDAIN